MVGQKMGTNKKKRLFREKTKKQNVDIDKILLEDAYDDFIFYLTNVYNITEKELKEIIKEYYPEKLI